MEWVNLILVIFFYIFTLALVILVVGTIAQYMNLKRRFDDRTINLMLGVIIASIYIAFVFLLLNDWAKDMLKIY